MRGESRTSANVSNKEWRSFGSLNPGAPGIRQRGVTPLMYQYGETVITQPKRWLVPFEEVN